MVQLIALEVYLRAAEMFRQALCKIQRRRTANIMLPEVIHLGRKGRIFLGRSIFCFQIEDQRHQRFGDIAATKFAETAMIVWPLVPCVSAVAH